MILLYSFKDLAPLKSWGFSLVAIWLPFGCHIVAKTTKNKAAKTATSRINTGFMQIADIVCITYTYPMHTLSAKKKEKKKAERKEAKERIKNKEK